ARPASCAAKARTTRFATVMWCTSCSTFDWRIGCRWRLEEWVVVTTAGRACSLIRMWHSFAMARRGMSRVARSVDGLTEQWIGWTFPPVQRAFDDATWMANDATSYCHRCGDSVGAGEATAQGCATCRAGGELDGGIADG